MAKTVVGTIIEKAYGPPPGAPGKYCQGDQEGVRARLELRL